MPLIHYNPDRSSMKWTTLLLSELNDDEIRLLMKKYSTLDMVYISTPQPTFL